MNEFNSGTTKVFPADILCKAVCIIKLPAHSVTVQPCSHSQVWCCERNKRPVPDCYLIPNRPKFKKLSHSKTKRGKKRAGKDFSTAERSSRVLDSRDDISPTSRPKDGFGCCDSDASGHQCRRKLGRDAACASTERRPTGSIHGYQKRGCQGALQ